MDLQKLFNSYETLLTQMKEDGYSESYIKSVRFEIHWIKRNPQLFQCTSYLELYEERIKTARNQNPSQEHIYHKRSLFTILQRFEENNEFPNRHQKVPLVQKTAYSKLHSNFKEIVDFTGNLKVFISCVPQSEHSALWSLRLPPGSCLSG
ncbi:MAG: hypothetical protein IJ794_03740 [Lachnospiraceae bacterium]|nr:hypothetical protein [Lachnospiraceae bacterium]